MILRQAAAMLLVWAAAAAAHADDTTTYLSKKHELIAHKARVRDFNRAAYAGVLAARVGTSPNPVVNIYHTHTREFVAVDRDALSLAGNRTDELFRCHYTGKVTGMDPRLVATLLEGARHFKAERIDIVSAYRSDKYNLILRKKGRQVARNSQHVLGNAVDFRIRGVTTKKLRAWARGRKLGGVGYYSGSKFIHVDVGRVRYWEGR